MKPQSLVADYCRPSRGLGPRGMSRYGLCIVLIGLLAPTLWAAGPAGNDLPSESPQAVPIQQLDAAFDTHAGHTHEAFDRQTHQDFASAVDLDAFRRLAVFDDGRVKILDTLAREHINRIYGKPRWKDIKAETVGLPPKEQDAYFYDPVFTYLDLILDRPYYADKPILYVEVLPFRERLLAHLPDETRETWMKIGRISLDMFMSSPVQAVFQDAKTSFTEAKGRDQLFFAADSLVNSQNRLNLVSPPTGSVQWTRLDQPVANPTDAPQVIPASAAESLAATVRVAGLDDLWGGLAEAWRQGDAEAVNQILGALTNRLPLVHPETYPADYRLTLEYIYNITGKFTIGYVFYGLSTLLLILALGTGRRWLLAAGVTLLMLGLLGHAGSFAIRALLSERWAIHNQYESFIAISLFAVLVGVLFMFLKRIWIFGAAAAALGTLSLLVANLWAIPSNEVGQVAGILATSRILYVHVNMVLVSYGLIALSFFVSLAYLFVHYVKGRQSAVFAASGVGRLDQVPGISEQSPATHKRKLLLADLDQAQLTVMQLAFWLLGVGILLGAYWADHAWGRWWAWDPKETWSLITWMVYLIAIHVRFGVRDRGLATAWLSVTGFVVMLWCYWGVNLLLAGLHSYA